MHINGPTPVSRHVELYRQWDAKRAGRIMPARRDIDPTEIPQVLPHLAIVDVADFGYRWRLMGTALAVDLGRDLTGQKFGMYVAPAQFVDEMIATFDRVLAAGRRLFEESVYQTSFGNIHTVSRLLLPLAVDDRPSMVIFTRISRANFVTLREDEHERMKGASGSIRGTFDINSLDDLEARAADWELRATGKARRMPGRGPAPSEFCARSNSGSF